MIVVLFVEKHAEAEQNAPLCHRHHTGTVLIRLLRRVTGSHVEFESELGEVAERLNALVLKTSKG